MQLRLVSKMFRPHLLLLSLLVVLLGHTATAERYKRTAADLRVMRWSKDKPIPYSLADNFSEVEKQKIRDALNKFSQDICLSFEENGAGGKLAYVRSENTCAGQLFYYGMPGDPKIELTSGCVHRQGIIHETLHGLGFRHTQCRHDRDLHVKVNPSITVNSEGNPVGNWAKLTYPNDTIDYGIPYEYNGLLHYDLADGKMDVVDENYRGTVRGSFLTFNELKMVNLRYKCDKVCSPIIECQNGGYQHPRKCNVCVCPQFYQGTLCNEEKGAVNLEMGVPVNKGFVFTKDDVLYNQPEPEMFSAFSKSELLLIKAPAGSHIRVNISYVDNSVSTRVTKCQYQGVEIVDGDLTRVGKRFCTAKHIGRTFISETNVVGYLMYARPGWPFAANVTFTAVGTPTSTTVAPVTTTTKAPAVTTTTSVLPPTTLTTTTKAPVVTTTTSPPPPPTTTTTKAPIVSTTTLPTSTGGAWCDL